MDYRQMAIVQMTSAATSLTEEFFCLGMRALDV